MQLAMNLIITTNKTQLVITNNQRRIKMKYPINLKLAYISDENCLPIGTVDSTHYINNFDDLSVLASYINVFSEHEWDSEELLLTISLSNHNFKTRTEQDPCLHLYVI